MVGRPGCSASIAPHPALADHSWRGAGRSSVAPAGIYVLSRGVCEDDNIVSSATGSRPEPGIGAGGAPPSTAGTAAQAGHGVCVGSVSIGGCAGDRPELLASPGGS